MFSLLGAVVLAPLLIGANCSPSERARSYGCPGGPAECEGSAQIPACINFCAPVPSAQVLASGADCALDPCDQQALERSDVYLPGQLHVRARG